MEPQQKNQDQKQAQSRKGMPGLIEDTITSTVDDMKAIVDAKLELFRIEMTEKVALASAVLILAVVLLIGAAYLLTSSALLIGELLSHPWLGYLIVSLVFIGFFAFFTKVKPEALKNFIHKILLSAHD
ncbi:MAG TPA: phage holin family protein [Chlorobaculum parvum]|uniref:Phage holin family protein n=1 Tax=Chlorobaculum parvum TaxID=274539 RepID=A0A7C5HLD2_9CHLB|nr:phage holin family protein [Chlorobaculum parvum]